MQCCSNRLLSCVKALCITLVSNLRGHIIFAEEGDLIGIFEECNQVDIELFTTFLLLSITVDFVIQMPRKTVQLFRNIWFEIHFNSNDNPILYICTLPHEFLLTHRMTHQAVLFISLVTPCLFVFKGQLYDYIRLWLSYTWSDRVNLRSYTIYYTVIDTMWFSDVLRRCKGVFVGD